MEEIEVAQNIDQYISLFPSEVQTKLTKIRAIIKEVEPRVVEVISYQMPTFKLNGKNLIHFAAYEKHIGLYPTPKCIENFADELIGYKTSKGAIQFPLNKPMPYDLILMMIKCRVDEVKSSNKNYN